MNLAHGERRLDGMTYWTCDGSEGYGAMQVEERGCSGMQQANEVPTDHWGQYQS